jgi:hypothetical protein
MLNLVGLVSSLPYLAILFAVSVLYNVVWENPRIESKAKEGLVTTFDKAAAEAELAERNRQASVALAAANAFNTTLREQQAALAAQSEQEEKRLDEWEADLKKKGRSCPINADDMRQLGRRVQ